MSRVRQASGVYVIGEVSGDGLIAHAVGSRDEFGIDRADEVDQPRGAQDPGLNADRTQRVLDVTIRRRGASGLGCKVINRCELLLPNVSR